MQPLGIKIPLRDKVVDPTLLDQEIKAELIRHADIYVDLCVGTSIMQDVLVVWMDERTDAAELPIIEELCVGVLAAHDASKAPVVEPVPTPEETHAKVVELQEEVVNLKSLAAEVADLKVRVAKLEGR